MKIKNFRHVGIVTTNLKNSLNFYENYLGLKKIKVINENKRLMKNILNLKNCDLTTVKLGYKKKIFLELLYFKNLKQKKRETKIFSSGLTHFSITIENLDKVYDNLKKKNINFLSKPALSHDRKVKLVFCKSPENIFIELVEIL
jgi:hypothetical protein